MGEGGGGEGRLSMFNRVKQRDVALHGAHMHVVGMLKTGCPVEPRLTLHLQLLQLLLPST